MLKTSANHLRSQRGYNLVEVLVAMGLLSVVLLSIFTLFVMGRRNVYSGKQMTQANAIGRNALEDFSNMSLDDVQNTFGITATTTLGNVDVDSTIDFPEDTYTQAILRKSNAIGTGHDPKGVLATWQAAINDNEKLGNGYVAVVLMPRTPFPTAAALTPATATVVQIRILVRWDEGARKRQAIFETAKVQRP